MFNESDMEALQEVRAILAGGKPTAFRFDITVEEVAEALDRAGVCGLVHDGTRVIARSVPSFVPR
jgi:hypothetical protein